MADFVSSEGRHPTQSGSRQLGEADCKERPESPDCLAFCAGPLDCRVGPSVDSGHVYCGENLSAIVRARLAPFSVNIPLATLLRISVANALKATALISRAIFASD